MTTLQATSSGFPEHRYLVIKEVDLYEAGRLGLIPLSHLQALLDIQNAITKVRAMNEKSVLESLIIEKNWPEYEPTKALLAARVMSELNAIDNGG